MNRIFELLGILFARSFARLNYNQQFRDCEKGWIVRGLKYTVVLIRKFTITILTYNSNRKLSNEHHCIPLD